LLRPSILDLGSGWDRQTDGQTTAINALCPYPRGAVAYNKCFLDNDSQLETLYIIYA